MREFIEVHNAKGAFGFPLKPGQSIWIIGEGVRQDLECDVPVELGVSGSIHLAHACAYEKPRPHYVH